MDNDLLKEVSKEIAKDAYTDAGKPILKPTGELIGLVSRAIKAALSPLEKWVLQREYNIAETQKLLEEKLRGVSPEEIESPEPYIAVPALQYISYCMDNEDLRNMYANLLANSMNKVVKNGVHPGFVEILKQLSPDEAKILNYFSFRNIVPTITLRFENDKKEGVDIVNNFSNIGELVGCENPLNIPQYFDNLIRLGLLASAHGLRTLINKQLYEPLINHDYIRQKSKSLPEKYSKVVHKESYVYLTEYGKAFCEICLDPDRILIINEKIVK